MGPKIRRQKTAQDDSGGWGRPELGDLESGKCAGGGRQASYPLRGERKDAKETRQAISLPTKLSKSRPLVLVAA